MKSCLAVLTWIVVNGESFVTLKPFGRIFKRDEQAAFGGVETTHKMSLPLPINVDFQAHGLAR